MRQKNSGYLKKEKKMIKATRAKESRQRDEKRQRILLTVGESCWHLSQNEAKVLSAQLQKLIIKDKKNAKK